MRNEEIKKLFDSRFALCIEHGTDIAVLKAGQTEIMNGINTLQVRQSDLIDKIEITEKDVLVLKTQRKGMIALVGTVASGISLALGIFIDHLLRRA